MADPIAASPRPPGMYDVARLAGVSHQTVSRVLNAHPNVKPETKRRVEAAIAELGYRRNVAARTLVTRRSSTIGVITSTSEHWGPSSTLVSVEAAARDAGYYVSVAGLRSLDATGVSDALSYFIDQSVEGIVVIAPEAAMAHMAQPFISSVPVVMVAAGADPAPGVQITSVDQELGAVLATRHLVDLGHTVIGHIAGPEPWFDATARLRGWRSTIRSAGLKLGPLLSGDWTSASGYRAGQQLISRGLPSAVFAANDLMALGLIRALHDARIKVPQQVSVVGFDDMPGASHFIPGLTTVRQDLESLGRQCIEILLRALAGSPVSLAPIAPTLVVRESTKKQSSRALSR
jgi:DNA-binding LacI/PurR family transcriptional regulator